MVQNIYNSIFPQVVEQENQEQLRKEQKVRDRARHRDERKEMVVMERDARAKGRKVGNVSFKRLISKTINRKLNLNF
jgi:hypothetical protein